MLVKYAVGNVVKLKSGGPKMTIVRVPSFRKHAYKEGVVDDIYDCAWYDETTTPPTLHRASFPHEALELLEE